MRNIRYLKQFIFIFVSVFLLFANVSPRPVLTHWPRPLICILQTYFFSNIYFMIFFFFFILSKTAFHTISVKLNSASLKCTIQLLYVLQVKCSETAQPTDGQNFWSHTRTPASSISLSIFSMRSAPFYFTVNILTWKS